MALSRTVVLSKGIFVVFSETVVDSDVISFNTVVISSISVVVSVFTSVVVKFCDKVVVPSTTGSNVVSVVFLIGVLDRDRVLTSVAGVVDILSSTIRLFCGFFRCSTRFFFSCSRSNVCWSRSLSLQ